MFSHTIIDPFTVMIILIDTSMASLAMVVSLPFHFLTRHAQLMQLTIASNGKVVVVMMRCSRLRGFYKGNVNREVQQVEYGLGYVDFEMLYAYYEVREKHDQKEGYYVQNRLEKGSLMGFVLYLGVAQEFQVVYAAIFIIEHGLNVLKLVLFSFHKGCLAFIVFYGSVCSRKQQQLHYFSVPIASRYMQGGMAILVKLVNPNRRGLGQQILYYLLAAAVGSPVQGSAIFKILAIQVQLFLMQIQYSIDSVSLSCKMQQIHTKSANNMQICFEFLQYSNHIDIPLEGCIMCSRIPFIIFLIKQLLSLGLYFHDRISLILQIFAVILDVKVQDAKLIMVGAMMNDRIFDRISNKKEVQRRLLIIEKQRNLFQLFTREQKFFLIFEPSLYNHSTEMSSILTSNMLYRRPLSSQLQMNQEEEAIHKKAKHQQFERCLEEYFQGDYQSYEKKSEISNTEDIKSSSEELTISWEVIEQLRTNLINEMKNIVIVQEGYLEKYTGKLLNKWQICYCILTSHKFYCYEDEKRIKLICCINFRFHSYQIHQQELQIRLSCHLFAQNLVFKAYTYKQIQAWHKNLQNVISSFDKFQKLNFLQSKKEIYQEKDALTETQFLALAQTGDLILMTTKAKGMLQRIVTNSDYDHVAMVIKFADGIVKVFESNPDQGVKIYQWPKYQMIFNHYEQISSRKLYIKDREALQQPMLKFIKQNIGKKYDLGLLKLIRTSSQVHSNEKGYFCSELVAKMYKSCGILAQNVASHKYWPIDFTEKGCLVLENEGCLGQQREIILNKHLKY